MSDFMSILYLTLAVMAIWVLCFFGNRIADRRQEKRARKVFQEMILRSRDEEAKDDDDDATKTWPLTPDGGAKT